MSYEKKPKVKLLSLWAMKGGRGYSGRLGDARVVAWINDRKASDRSPDLTVYLEEGEPYQKKAPDAGKTEQHREERAPGADDGDELF